eukprot:tig00000342_g24243.t1
MAWGLLNHAAEGDRREARDGSDRAGAALRSDSVHVTEELGMKRMRLRAAGVPARCACAREALCNCKLPALRPISADGSGALRWPTRICLAPRASICWCMLD